MSTADMEILKGIIDDRPWLFFIDELQWELWKATGKVRKVPISTLQRYITKSRFRGGLGYSLQKL